MLAAVEKGGPVVVAATLGVYSRWVTKRVDKCPCKNTVLSDYTKSIQHLWSTYCVQDPDLQL